MKNILLALALSALSIPCRAIGIGGGHITHTPSNDPNVLVGVDPKFSDAGAVFTSSGSVLIQSTVCAGSQYILRISSSDNTTIILEVECDGDVGINNSQPATKLHLSTGTMTIDGTGGLFIVSTAPVVTAASADFQVSSNTIVATIDGRVGIGTAVPATKLHFSSGTLTIDGTGGTLAISTTPVSAVPPNAEMYVSTNYFVVTNFGASMFNTAIPAVATLVTFSSGAVLVNGAAGSLNVSSTNGAGFAFQTVCSTAIWTNPGTVAATACVDSSAMTCTGATVRDQLMAGADAANAAVTGVSTEMRISASNSVIVRTCCNNGAAGTCATAAGYYKVSVFRGPL